MYLFEGEIEQKREGEGEGEGGSPVDFPLSEDLETGLSPTT